MARVAKPWGEFPLEFSETVYLLSFWRGETARYGLLGGRG